MTNQRIATSHSTLQSRTATITALFMTIFLLCIEHVRAFANQFNLSPHDAMVLASAASSLSRKLSQSCLSLGKANAKKVGFSGAAASRGGSGEGSSTKLSMAWSIPAISLPAMPVLTSKDLPVHTLGSWYSEVDPTNKLPVYDDEYENSYSFRSPTDDWPSIDSPNQSGETTPVARRRPLRAIRRAAVRFVEGVARFPHSNARD